MKLSQFPLTTPITIQCHDNPDADAIASGYALYTYFKRNNYNVKLIYSGHFQIQKTNLVAMIELLEIPIIYTTIESIEGVLITVDCQYGSGNVKKIVADEIAIIDHHQPEVFDVANCEIHSAVGSCSTLIWQLLTLENFNINEEPLIATALYYGLFTDTSQFAELSHPLDKDMLDYLDIDKNIIKRLKNSNLSLSEIEIAGLALIRYTYNNSHRYALIKSQPCDPNILGLISDMMLQVDTIDTCLVYSELPTGIKLSVRSCVKEINANELADYLTQSVGSGGGHIEKAGGFISYPQFHEHYPGLSSETYFLNRLDSYHSSFDIINARTFILDTSNMACYQKLTLPMGYIRTSDFLPPNTPALIRTLNGDIDITVNEEMYILINFDGEISPISKDKFESRYKPSSDYFKLDTSIYCPSIRNKLTGKSLLLQEKLLSCIPKNHIEIYAKQLIRTTKVFTLLDQDKYMYGAIGDYIAVCKDDPQDIYIVHRDTFYRTHIKLSN